MKRWLLAIVIVLVPGSLHAQEPVRLSDDVLAARLNEYVTTAEKDGFSGAILVARAGRILVEAGYGVANPATGAKVRTDTVFTTGSITKQFTAAAIMRLESAGKLSVKDSIGKYFDAVPEDKKGITLHQLLTHSAGFPGAIGDDFERVGRDEFVRRALATPLLFAPGTKYEYSNVGYSLLAAIVERVSGKAYEEFLRTSFFEPAGMKDTGYLLPKWDPSRLAHGMTNDGGDWGTLVDKAFRNGGPGWHLVGNGGIHSTVGDMYRWHVALESGKLVPAAELKKMYTPWVEEPGGSHYGYGWSIENTPRDTRLIGHNGGNPFFFSDFWRFLDEDVVIYYSTNSRDRRFRRLAPALASIVFRGEAPPLQKKSTELSGPPAAPDTPAGRWKMPDDPRAQTAAGFLDALSLKAEEERKAYVAKAFDEGSIERNGIDRLVELLVRLRGDLGEFDYRGLGDIEGGVEVRLFSTSEQMPFRLRMKIEPKSPYRISGLAVEAGE